MCRRCRTGYYCVGDGTELPCGKSSPTEYSFAGASKCDKCPEGWVRIYTCLYVVLLMDAILAFSATVR